MVDDPGSRGPARAGMLDLLHLLARQGAGSFRRKGFDGTAVGCRWARDLMQRDGGTELEVSLPGQEFEIVGSRAHSAQILAGQPGADGYESGRLKTDAMRFLAPGALTIVNGEEWTRLRAFNERVLGTGLPHPFAQAFLRHVRAAFALPVLNRDAVSEAMGRAMVKIVLGDLPAGESDPAADVRVLFDVVQSPLRRKFLAFWYRRRRERLYEMLAKHLERSAPSENEETLLSLAKAAAPGVDRDTVLQQVPHWMFTFTGSGSDLLTRTIALVTSRPAVHAKVLQELRDAGAPDKAETIARLPYLNACFLETGRLFPPVTKTFHRRVGDGRNDSREIVHYFPLLQRDDRLGPSVHQFQPERWTSPRLDDAAAASNLFLRGPRACPGMDLILFVCKGAAVRLIGELKLSARNEFLARDPLPLSYPQTDAPFSFAEDTQ